MSGPADRVSMRVLLLAPVGRDAAVARSVLQRESLHAHVCGDLVELIEGLAAGAGATVITEEALGRDDPELLLDWVVRQPPWSDLPFIVLTDGSETYARPQRLARTIAQLRNATLLERPLHSASLLSAVRSALRARRWQYQVRRQLRRLERAGLEQRALAETLEVKVGERTAALAEANRQLLAEIEERRRTEDALRQAQKMQAVGELTGGLAHDFNNMLTVVGTNLDLLRERLHDAPDLERLAEAALRGVDRAAKLTHQLLAFSRKQRLEPRRIDLNAVVAGMSDLFRRTVGDAIEIRAELAPDLHLALADPNQVETVLLNLVLNARDALSEHGAITISTRNATLEPEDGLGADAAPGSYVELAVADGGCGMSDEVLARAFEPFFTTKEVGKGSGLGLSMVYGFVRQSGGAIKLESAVGRGTSVRVLLPMATGQASPEPPRLAVMDATRCDGIPLGGRALVVEDHDAVREIAAAMLADIGYGVLEASDAQAAFDVLAADPDFDLVFTDVTMPGEMSGVDLVKIVAARWPRIAVVLTSGYAERLATSGELPAGFVFLQKPYRPANLVAAVHAALERSTATARKGSNAPARPATKETRGHERRPRPL
jgi:signal transduction histidine kinase/CheY-like chemotaxis protein